MKDILQDDNPAVAPPLFESADLPGMVRSGDQTGWHLLSPANSNHPVPVPGHSGRVSGFSLYRNAGKRVFDILFVIATVPVSLPVILAGAIALWAEGGAPFYRQDRLGRAGNKFSILKLRTMVRDADAQLEQYLAKDPEMRAAWDASQKLKNDPRITRVGGFLRTTSLDELPQLWNVLKGEMSLVGPRPMMPQQLPLYGDAQAYFAVQPGITGIWQVSARNETRFSHRALLDRQYLQNLTFRNDLALLLRTVGVVFRRTGY